VPDRVAVVTDSTAALPDALARRAGVTVVPLDVTIDGVRHDASRLTPAELLAALERNARVSTSQPPPAAFAAAYARAVASGATEIVSVHLSGALSGTVDAARLAARDVAVPVHVVDARTATMALGFAALAAAGTAASLAETAATSVPARRSPWWRRRREPAGPTAPPGPSAGELVAGRAAEVAGASRVWFLVDSLEHLRRGGRLGAASTAIGTVLGLRPLLTVRDGGIVVAERVRTRRAARERLVGLAAADAEARPGRVRVAVLHLGRPEVASALAEQLATRLGDRVVDSVVCESDAVIAAHVGPGLLAIVVAGA
jgi:fatty acid-binding protein DegV